MPAGGAAGLLCQARQAPSRTLTVPGPLLYVLYVLYGSHKASH